MTKVLSLPQLNQLNAPQVNTAFTNIEAAFENTLSRDGSTPNNMLADLDMDSNDIINVNIVYGQSIDVVEATIGGKLFTGSLTWRSSWLTATSYQNLDLVKINGNVYVCLEEHTSGVFATDLSSLKWELFVENAVGPEGPQGDPGAQGDPGVGVPAGGTTGQVLAKIDNTDYNTQWTSAAGGVSDGDKGDITVSGSGATWTIDNGVVSLAKMANMATSSLIYRKTAGSGAPEVNTLATLKTDLGLTGTNSGDQTITLTSDVTGSGTGSFATTIAANAVSNTKLADVPTATFKGRTTAGTGDPEDLTVAQAKTLLNLTGTNSGDQTITLTGVVTGSGTGSFATSLGSFTKAQLDTAVSDGNVLYVGDVTTNATHTGDVTGSGALTIDPTAITGKTTVTAVGTDYVLISDTSDSGNLKKALVSDLTGGGGGTPGGSSGEIQYNNAGAFGGAVDAEIEGGQLRFPSIATPTAPAADGIKLYTKSQVGQRDMLAILYPNGREARLDEDESEFLQLQYRPAPNSGLLVGDGTLPMTITGTATASTVQVTNFYLMYPRIEARATTAATNAIAGFRSASSICRVGNDANAPGGFNYRCAWGPAAYSIPSTHRALCGLLNVATAPTDVEPSTMVNGIWMGWDAADTNVQIMHNDGTGTATKIDLGASFAVPTGTDNNVVYLLELYSPNESTQSVEYHVIKYNAATRSPAASASGTITTDLPSVTTLLTHRVWGSAGGTSAQIGIALFGVSIDLDYS